MVLGSSLCRACTPAWRAYSATRCTLSRDTSMVASSPIQTAVWNSKSTKSGWRTTVSPKVGTLIRTFSSRMTVVVRVVLLVLDMVFSLLVGVGQRSLHPDDAQATLTRLGASGSTNYRVASCSARSAWPAARSWYEV